MPSIDTNISLDTKKAEDELEWKINTSLDLGLSKTIDWYKSYFSLPL